MDENLSLNSLIGGLLIDLVTARQEAKKQQVNKKYKINKKSKNNCSCTFLATSTGAKGPSLRELGM